MLADFFTKPLQGKGFNIFRVFIMGWEHIDTTKKLMSSPAKGFIGKQESEEYGQKGKRKQEKRK